MKPREQEANDPKRGGSAPKLAALGEYCGFIEADAAWHFLGSPTPPEGLQSTERRQWLRAVSIEADKIYSAAGLRNKLCEGLNEIERKGIIVSEETWQRAREILECYIMEKVTHEGPRANNDKNDPRSMGYFQKQLRDDLLRMAEILAKRLEDKRLSEFDWLLREKSYRLGDPVKTGTFISDELKKAYLHVAQACSVVEFVEIEGKKYHHEADTRRRFGKRLKDLALSSGHDGKKFVKAFNIYAETSSDHGFDVWYQRLNGAD
jgi:hypothetical protein